MASTPYQHEWELKRTDLLGTWRELEPVIAACTRRIPDMKIAGYSLLSDAATPAQRLSKRASSSCLATPLRSPSNTKPHTPPSMKSNLR